MFTTALLTTVRELHRVHAEENTVFLVARDFTISSKIVHAYLRRKTTAAIEIKTHARARVMINVINVNFVRSTENCVRCKVY